jgi:ketosteroid isomerase-like protein
VSGVSGGNADLARRGYAAAARGDLDTVREFLHPEVRWHGGDPDAEGACRNRDEALEFMRRARLRGVMGELVEVIEAGEDRVVVIMRRLSADGGDELVANLTTFREGRAIEMVHYPRAEDALAAAGISR